jgi:Dolichyl-phosphate-mannose-protein mannosyltransferase
MNNRKRQAAACFVICFLLVAGIQRWSGASQAAFDGYPDEPSHYLGGLMVRDYLAAGFPLRPRAYAINYYLHIPFFAIGYWPPLFYVVEGLWMAVIGYSRPETLLFLGFIAALISATIFALARPAIGAAGAFCCAVLFLLLPDVLSNNLMVMTDTAVALLSLWSVLALTRYFKNGKWSDSILFAFLASCTIMTKYSGVYLALLPPLGLLIGKRWDLLRRPSFWFQPLAVALLCAPWILYTSQYATTGFASYHGPDLVKALFTYFRLWALDLGPWMSALLLGGWIYQSIFLAEADVLRQMLWLQPVCLLSFQLLAPVGIETRYLTPALAPLIVLLSLSLARLPKWYGPAVMAAIVAGYSVVTLTHLPRPVNELRPVVEAITRAEDKAMQSLVYVPADKEGPMIAEFAMRDANRPVRILARPNKLLAHMDWLGNHYKSDYERPADLERYFEENPPDLLILHSRLASSEFPHERLLETTIRQYPNSWRLSASSTGYEVYQFAGSRNAGEASITPLYRNRITGRFENQ